MNEDQKDELELIDECFTTGSGFDFLLDTTRLLLDMNKSLEFSSRADHVHSASQLFSFS